MENRVKGYKAFNVDLTNRYGSSFEVGKRYSVDGNAVFGNHGNGFHFCERLEDTLRYFDAMNGEIAICEVVGSGNIVEYSDEYYGYYEMFAATELEISKVLTREEIVGMFRDAPWYRTVRFVQGFRLTDVEREFFKLQYENEFRVLQAIAYYQEGDNRAYEDDKGFKFMKKLDVIV
jgi:hypothetical protein